MNRITPAKVSAPAASCLFRVSRPSSHSSLVSRYRHHRNPGRVLRPDADRRSHRDVLLFPDRGLRLGLLVLAASPRIALPGALGATPAAQSTDRDLRVPGFQQQVHQPGAQRPAQEPQWQERQLLRREQAHAESQEDVHMIQKTTGRLRLGPRLDGATRQLFGGTANYLDMCPVLREKHRFEICCSLVLLWFELL